LGRVEEVVRGLGSSAKWNLVQALSSDSNDLESEMSLPGDLALEEMLLLLERQALESFLFLITKLSP
jgi:hypothetical protein